MSWKKREAKRLQDGTYKHVPWEDQFWYVPVENHYAHISTENPRQVAYTPSDSYGVEDRQVRMRPGKYVAKYFPGTNSVTRELAVQTWNGTVVSKVKIATTRDEIREVYMNGPRSCMKVAFDYLPCHPTEAYASGTLGIAYLGSLTDAYARTLVHLEKQLFYPPRYGEARELWTALLTEGKWEEGTYKDFRHAPLLEIPWQGMWVVPYVDCWGEGYRLGDGFIRLGTTDEAKVVERAISLEHTSGTSQEAYYCDSCGNSSFDEDFLPDGYSCAGCIQPSEVCVVCEEKLREGSIYVSETGEPFCPDCFYDNHTYCARCARNYPNDSPCSTHTEEDVSE